MSVRVVGLAGGALLAIAVGWPTATSTQERGLTGAAQIAQVYDAILDARFDELPDMLRTTCAPPSPRGADGRPPAAVCDLLSVVSLWWQIQLDPLDPSRDEAFERQVNGVVATMEAWTRAEPSRAEAWFYLGGAYGARSQWRVLRGQLLSAARDGKRIKESLERALVLNPLLTDAYFGIGLYHYYADVAPAAAKLLRFLLLLPGGDKGQGMREMLQARSGGQLLRGEADYQLHVLYLWYEHQPERARDLITGLAARYPRNAHFPQLVAEINDIYLHDDTAALRAWEAMLMAAQQDRFSQRATAEARARVGFAVQLDRLYETDLALAHLNAVDRSGPVGPYAITAEAAVLRGQMLDRLGQRTEAEAAYRDALAGAGRDDPRRVATRARAGLRRAPRADATRAYRLSVQGWRAIERGAYQEADDLLRESLRLQPADLVTRYRQAKLREAQGNDMAAFSILEALLSTRTDSMGPTFLGYALVDAAALAERLGLRARAIDFYTHTSMLFGADARTLSTAARALTRLGVMVAPQR